MASFNLSRSPRGRREVEAKHKAFLQYKKKLYGQKFANSHSYLWLSITDTLPAVP